MVTREAERRRSSIVSIPEDLLMFDDHDKPDEESTLRAIETANHADNDDQKTEQDDLPSKEDAQLPCESANSPVDDIHHILPVQTIRPLFSNRVLPLESTSSRREEDRTLSNNYSSKFLTRQSITKSFSEKIKEIIHDIKLVPFMNDAEREDYEIMVLADVCGKLETSDLSSPTVLVTQNPEIIDDQENQLIN
eukprot:CAMPEP_0173160824 /NCGR_PEP_ID=MMETSP1105-20130129/18166_1 /TAXON_ID=2985 /ORGANISM="Ochromonas sp., Strain BG-1" /LENGTH=192 /DNA_ID=CAMNT_0014079985 /DNA_START=1490 /DNA_END=2068 /DNA_ORIENTATION=+